MVQIQINRDFMLEDFITPDIDSLDHFDTSDLDGTDMDDYDFTDGIGEVDAYLDINEVGADDLNSSLTSDIDEEINEPTPSYTKYRNIRPGGTSFCGGTHCMEYGCGCRNFEGTFGTVCTNCGHGYSKHF